MRESRIFPLVVVALMLLAAAVYGFTYAPSAGTNTNPIQFGSIAGSYGYEASASGAGNQVTAQYGHHCSGASCSASAQALNFVHNILLLTATWHPTDEVTTYGVQMTTQITNKTGHLTCQDETRQGCGPQPAYSDACWVSMTEGAPGANGGSTYMGTGDSMMHTGIHNSPGTNRNYTYIDGTPVASNDIWTVNPDDPNTLSYTCSATVVTSFMGSASEVKSVNSWSKATCTLTLDLLPQ